MLGNLFKEAMSSLASGGPSKSSRPPTSIESVQEDIHTRSLLYPDAEALYQHQHDQAFPLASSNLPLLASSLTPFDTNPDTEMDPKDVRIVVMQEASSAVLPVLLYDSHTSPELDPRESLPKANGSQPLSTPRRISLGQTSRPVVISNPPRSAFDRRPSHNRATSFAETEGQKSAREYSEELKVLSSCMFGNSDLLAYKGTGVKVHILPAESKSTSPFAEANGSFGKSSVRSSKLAQSYTSESILSPSVPVAPSRTLERKKVLITRIFPVILAYEAPSDSKNEYPFPEVQADGTMPERKDKPKQKRTPLYAVGLIITLPATHAAQLSRSSFRPGSYTEESMPSSFGSTKPTGWTVLGDGFGVESLESSIMSEGDDRIDVITKRWDIIVRTMTHIQAIMTARIHELLKQADAATPMSYGHKERTASISVAGKRVLEVRSDKSAGTNAKLVHLQANALMTNENVKSEVDLARARVVNGIKSLRVVTRQGRWGIWRDEARWMTKWIEGKEGSPLLYNILSAFLGTHTDWLQALGPPYYRRRHYQHQRNGRDDEMPLSARTIIISQDKMAARRLVFLLSAFLTPNQQQQPPYTRTYRPSSAASFGGYSQSPPGMYMANKEESLRRKVNKRKHTHNRRQSLPAQTQHDHERRNSDLKTANLPIPGSDGGTKKSGAVTTTAVTPVTTVPHFSTRQRTSRGTGPVPRPGSSGSLATEDLMRTLKRGDSSGQYSNASSDSQSGSKWGSVTSWSGKMGFWNKRRDSTCVTDVTLEEEPQKSKLTQMVEEARGSKDAARAAVSYQIPDQAITVDHSAPLPYQSPIKSRVNEEDGVIDIEVPLPDFMSTFGSAISSPSSSGYLSGMGPGLEGFEHYTRGVDADAPLNVGGWLPRFHPDFTLQAIPIHEGFQSELETSMRAEPTPVLTPSSQDQWGDISTALVIDITNFSIKRLKYQRIVKAFTPPETQADTTDIEVSLRNISLYGYTFNGTNGNPTPAPTAPIEDRFEEEVVVSFDETFKNAIERILSQPIASPMSAPTSTSSSQLLGSSSRSSSRSGGSANGSGRMRSNSSETQRDAVSTLSLEVPRGECKKYILGALEEVARSVSEARHNDVAKEQEAAGNDGLASKSESILRQGVAKWFTAIDERGCDV